MRDFYCTPAGRRFIDHTVPDIAVQLQRIANSLDRLLDLVEKPAVTPSAAPTKPEAR